MSKLVLLDGNSVAFRMFFALPLLSNDQGVYTNAVYGFTKVLLKVLEEEQPTHMAVAFDAGKTTFRHDTYEAYKSGREKTPDELSEQLPLLRDVLDAFGVQRFELENYEADDIIGTLAKEAEGEGFQVKVFSGDKDLLQLVSKQTSVAFTQKGISDVHTYDVTAFHEAYGLEPAQLVDLKGLMGDSSDNIPGVPGIGEKTALKMLKAHGDVEGVLSSIEQISGKKTKERLQEHQDQARMSRDLAVIRTDVPLTEGVEATAYDSWNYEKVVELFQNLGFQSLLKELEKEAGIEHKLDDIEVALQKTFTEEMTASPAALVVETPDENYHHSPVWGITVSNENGTFVMELEDALASDRFKQWAGDESKEKVVFDAKQTTVALGWQGVHLQGVRFDALIASYLIDPSASAHDLAAIAERQHGDSVLHDEDVYGKGAKQQKPGVDELAQHIGRKGEALLKLQPVLLEALKANNQIDLFESLEMPLSLILGRMETYGVQVDEKQLQMMGEELNETLTKLEQEIHELAGEAFNINSPKQLGPILFEKLELPVLKKTKTGYSTSADILEKLQDEHEIIPKLLHYRQVSKLKSTYVDGLLKVVHPSTGKIHTMFNQAITQTGRLSSAEPNLQNIPIRLEEGRKIRKAFIPSQNDWMILAADYSQIELRVLAHMSQDERLIEAFREDMDIHTKTAMDVFQVQPEEVTDQMRRSAKAVNFGIVYGISDYGLSQSLGISRNEAQSFIDTYFATYPSVKAYMDEQIENAREQGYVTTLMHRRRYLPEITSKNFNRRSFAERTAMNTPIQGSAADVIKKAMVDVEQALIDEGLESRLLLQVHDELIFEIPPHELDAMKRLVPRVMEGTIELDVPLQADVAYGDTWYDAK
ncbi:DNA polymerase I [Salsuginibacillus halophilus]|uniref:DNA polymerase I n=1 Tax=Salsuginibacillus halophilus TaxID=517424 RepID=A0A2P8HCW1_9BACI|nr:DNA polymerase I [Salsuginibacillus halophilus]PSL44066.1 DNA polymerase I [Salsuginibacillus halophilus]